MHDKSWSVISFEVKRSNVKVVARNTFSLNETFSKLSVKLSINLSLKIFTKFSVSRYCEHTLADQLGTTAVLEWGTVQASDPRRPPESSARRPRD